eukprot:1349469-Rhodomonas_salina.1
MKEQSRDALVLARTTQAVTHRSASSPLVLLPCLTSPLPPSLRLADSELPLHHPEQGGGERENA